MSVQIFKNPFYVIPGNMVDIVLSEQYSMNLSNNTRSYAYSYLCLPDGTKINTIGFSPLGIHKLVDEINTAKFFNCKRLHVFDVNLVDKEFTKQSECMPIIPYVDTSQDRDNKLSRLSKKIVKFIDGLANDKSHGILVTFFREFNDGNRVKKYAAHVSPLLVVPDIVNFVVFIFDGTGFELMGRQDQYSVTQIPSLLKSSQNCFAFSLEVLKKCLSNPEIILDLMSKRSALSDQFEQLTLQDLPAELIQYLESVSGKIKYLQQSERKSKCRVMASQICQVGIRTLMEDGSIHQVQKVISCVLYNKTYKYALKLLADSELNISLILRKESEIFFKHQTFLRDYQLLDKHELSISSRRRVYYKIAVIVGCFLLAFHLVKMGSASEISICDQMSK